MKKKKRAAGGTRPGRRLSKGLTRQGLEVDIPAADIPRPIANLSGQPTNIPNKPARAKLPVYPEDKRRLWSSPNLPISVRLLYAVLSSQKELESNFYFRPSSTICAELTRALEILGYNSVPFAVVQQVFRRRPDDEFSAQPTGVPIATLGGRISRSGPRLSPRLWERHYLIYTPDFQRLIDPAAFYGRELRDLLFSDDSLMAPALVPVEKEEILRAVHPIGFLRDPYVTAYSIHDDWVGAQVDVRGSRDAEVESRAVSIAWRAASVIAMMKVGMPGFIGEVSPELSRIIGTFPDG